MTASHDSFWQRALRSAGLGIGRAAPSGAMEPEPSTTAYPPLSGVTSGPLAPGALFAGYRIERQLARGSMGVLYLATDPRDGSPVAMKTLALAREFESADLDEARERFLAEAQAASRLQHPDIVAVFGAGESQGLAFIVMELLSGCDLTRYARPARLLPEPVVLRICARVAEALAYAHRMGIVHRDIKPANVMVDLTTHQVKITDFGIARLTDGGRTRSGLVLGTPSYMAPEQLAGAAADRRSDLYSLGVMLFQLLTGQLPYDASSMGQLLQQIAAGAPRDVRSLRPGVPDALAEVIALSLQKRPELRYADGQQLADDLCRIEADWSTTAWPEFGTDPQGQGSSETPDPGHNAQRS